jgi:uncharacterized cupredoxin-like copper-binding protein
MRLATLTLLVASSLIALGLLMTRDSGEASSDPTIIIRHSRFLPGVVTVRAGEPVTFTLVNNDPIEHEWIVGTDEVHERHRSGTEPYHDQVPTEVTIPALQTRLTTLTFDKPGSYSFICHLPGHEAYGMKSTLKVVAN